MPQAAGQIIPSVLHLACFLLVNILALMDSALCPVSPDARLAAAPNLFQVRMPCSARKPLTAMVWLTQPLGIMMNRTQGTLQGVFSGVAA